MNKKKYPIPATIVIRLNGDETTATIMGDEFRTRITRSLAKRNPKDEYDAYIGARVALDRLFDKEFFGEHQEDDEPKKAKEEPKPRWKTGDKVVAVNAPILRAFLGMVGTVTAVEYDASLKYFEYEAEFGPKRVKQMYDAVMSGDITEPKMEMEYSKYGDKVKNALTDLADYSEDYAFLPSDYKPSSYTDPKNKNKEYVLDDAAKAKYRELYDEEYANVMEAVIKSSKYRSASAEKRAELLEAARDDVAPQVKEEFLKWLAKNYKSTPKKK